MYDHIHIYNHIYISDIYIYIIIYTYLTYATCYIRGHVYDKPYDMNMGNRDKYAPYIVENIVYV